MEMTEEQVDIINSTGDIKINAVAGSGKTTTIIEYAKARPSTSRILYLAFNKSVKIEALKKFADKGLTNVRVETAHSLAYKQIVSQSKYKVRPQGYKTTEIAELLNLQQRAGEKHTQYIAANHINKLAACFCNSDKEKVQDLDYLHTIKESKSLAFVLSCYDYLVLQARLLLSKMDKGAIEITHDFYLKKFQLSNPTLFYDYILFDEGQDASPAMLSVFLRQKATKVIVGDTHQQIYGWRYAVNSLEKVDFKAFNLSTGFRFSQEVANLATEVLNYKKHVGPHQTIPITGMGSGTALKSKAVLGRTNLGLLLKAIQYVTQMKSNKRIYFEGNFNSYTYAEDGASLYDVLNLFNHTHHLIKDKLIRAMKDLDELQEYVDKTEDTQLGMMLGIVKEYGNRIPGLIKTIKERHVDNDEKEKAEMIFSTVHRCKGMEYDDIQLVNDFISEEKLIKLMEEKNEEKNKDTADLKVADRARLMEEINLLYVAVTRTKNRIHIPEELMPKNFPPSPQILVLRPVSEEEKKEKKKGKNSIPKQPAATTETKTEKARSVEPVRTKHQDAPQPWTTELDDELTIMFCKGSEIKAMALHFGRTKRAIKKRIKRLDLKNIYQ